MHLNIDWSGHPVISLPAMQRRPHRALRAMAGLVAELFAPVTSLVSAVLAPIGSALMTAARLLRPVAAALSTAGALIGSTALSLVYAVASAISGVLGPPITLMAFVLRLVSQLLGATTGLIQAVISGPLIVLSSAWVTITSLGSNAILYIKPIGLFFK